ncbi:MAG TPA: hypothetical protein VHX66_15875 [Solirubrobacteraceae bacterium]|jgi:hypothetical protein|nr:hypothetical protein [Solirubrobacteraceae bacterium]
MDIADEGVEAAAAVASTLQNLRVDPERHARVGVPHMLHDDARVLASRRNGAKLLLSEEAAAS